MLANLLVDVRFSEIPQAFSEAIVAVATKGIIHGLDARFSNLLEYVAFVAFGTTEREAVPSWFLQNYESFLAACIHRLLIMLSTDAQIDGHSPELLAKTRRAFEMVFDLTTGAKQYLSLDCLTNSSGAHAVLVVCNHSKYQFLKHESRVSPIFSEFMNSLAEKILDEEGNHDVSDVQCAFGYYSGSMMWRKFARDCIIHGDENATKWISKLEDAVTRSYTALQDESAASLQVLLKKREREEDEDTDTPTRPTTPTDCATSSDSHPTPPEKRRVMCSPIRKKSPGKPPPIWEPFTFQ